MDESITWSWRNNCSQWVPFPGKCRCTPAHHLTYSWSQGTTSQCKPAPIWISTLACEWRWSPAGIMKELLGYLHISLRNSRFSSSTSNPCFRNLGRKEEPDICKPAYLTHFVQGWVSSVPVLCNSTSKCSYPKKKKPLKHSFVSRTAGKVQPDP